MKINIRLFLIILSLFCCEAAIGQNEWFTLKALHIIKGLDNTEYFREILIANHFNLSEKGKIDNTINGYYEYWKSGIVEVDIQKIPGTQNTIRVRINEALTGVPERFVLGVTQLFPHKKIEKKDENIAILDGTLINKEERYNLIYSRDIDNVVVYAWFHYPDYCFNFQE